MNKYLAPILFAVTVIVRLLMHLATGYTVDDAFITFRYAENIALGHGFVYNLGEHVLGTTSPFFAIFLSFYNLVGISSLSASLMINVIAAGMTAVVLYRWGTRIGLKSLSVFAPLLYAFYPRFVICDIAELETGLITFLIMISFYLLYTERHMLSILAASFASITRPEGILLLLIVLLVSCWKKPKKTILYLVPALLILGNWLLFSYLYFGSVVPNSLLAKMVLYRGRTDLLKNLAASFDLGNYAVTLFWALVVWGCVVFWKRNKIIFVAGIYALFNLLALAVSGTHIFFWYPTPLYPILILIAVVGTYRILGLQSILKRFRDLNLTRVAVTVLLLASLSFALSRRVDGLKSEMSWYEQTHAAAAEYLTLNGKPSERLLAEDIGNLGYIYRRNIIDRDGLVTPQAISYNASGEFEKFIDSVNADWLFLAEDSPEVKEITRSKAFEARYQSISYQSKVQTVTHQLYRRTGK